MNMTEEKTVEKPNTLRESLTYEGLVTCIIGNLTGVFVPNASEEVIDSLCAAMFELLDSKFEILVGDDLQEMEEYVKHLNQNGARLYNRMTLLQPITDKLRRDVNELGGLRKSTLEQVTREIVRLINQDTKGI